MNQQLALSIMKTGVNVMLTGQAGAGKTYTLNSYIEYLKKRKIKYAVTASTGIAASHLNGSTIHSWSGMGVRDELSASELDKIKEKKTGIKDTGVLFVDEISMLHSKQLILLDEILRHCRENDSAFGGIQIIVCGDFFQLPPVESAENDSGSAKYCFMSPVWLNADFKICYLTKQYRQNDDQLSTILNQIRDNSVSEESIELLKSTKDNFLDSDVTKLYTHNENVDSINNIELSKIKGKTYSYQASFEGANFLCEMIMKQSRISSDFEYKIGALVMFTKNNEEFGYNNGTCGKVVQVIEDDELGTLPVVLTNKGEKIIPQLEKWSFGEDGEDVASVMQLPLRLAWAITVHKSQGMTLEGAEIDLGKAFTSGQGYVALSRLKSLSGMRLIGLNDKALQIYSLVRKADSRFRELSCSLEDFYKSHDFSDAQKKFLKYLRENGYIVTGTRSRSGFKQGKSKVISSISKHKIHNKESIDSCLKFDIAELAKTNNISISAVVRNIEQNKISNRDLDILYLKPKESVTNAVSKAIKAYVGLGKETPFRKNNALFLKNFIKMNTGESLSEVEIYSSFLFLNNSGENRIWSDI